MNDENGTILLQLNVAGWQTGMVGGEKAVEFWARHRQTGQVLLSRAPASHAKDAVRWLAARCSKPVDAVAAAQQTPLPN